ncbi:MAG: EthD domain-containing protein [Acidobacteria bacterium]|nr:EthD domain-containing protein [Acidobacteriota bacterium]
MIKLIYCLRRLQHLSLEEFQVHWLEHHSQFGLRLKALRRYVQYHTLANDPTQEAMAQAGVSSVEPFDGIMVAWWDSIEALHTEMERNSDVAAALEDEKLFIDHRRSIACIAQEHVIVEPEGAVPYVYSACLRRRSEIDRADFQKAWLNPIHLELIHRAHAQGLVRGYMQNHTLLGDAGRVEGLGKADDPWDGISAAYFDSVAKYKALVASRLVAQEAFEDERKYIDHSRSVHMLMRRHVIKNIVR